MFSDKNAQQTHLSARQGRDVHHVDVENQIQALRLDAPPALVWQRCIQEDGRFHIVQLVVSSVGFDAENANKRAFWLVDRTRKQRMRVLMAAAPKAAQTDGEGWFCSGAPETEYPKFLRLKYLNMNLPQIK